MANVKNTDTLNVYPSKEVSSVVDKQELTIAFNQLTEEEKAAFYSACEAGISPEELRNRLHQKIKQLWQA